MAVRLWCVLGILLIFATTGVHAQQQQVKDFITACKTGNMKVVKRTEKDGFDIKSSLTKDGSTALMIAAAAGQNEVIRFLIEKGANVNAKKDFGYTPLMISIINNRTETARLLIDNGAKIVAQTTLKESPFIFAIEKCNTELVGLLIDKGADIAIKTKVGQKPLLIAATKGCKDVLEVLVENGINIEEGTEADSTTALMKAAKFGHLESVKLLLENGAQANKRNRQGNSAFMFAVQNGHFDIMQLLIEKGADINERNLLGYTPLLYALDHHFTEIVKFLIENGADVNAVTKNDMTPIKIVKKEKDSVLVVYLVEHGAIDPDSTKAEEKAEQVKTDEVKENEANVAPLDSSVVLTEAGKEDEKVLTKDIAESNDIDKEANNLEKKEAGKRDEEKNVKLDEKEKKKGAEKETKETMSQTPGTIPAKQDSIKKEKKVDLNKLAEAESVPHPEGGFRQIQQNLKLPRIAQEGEISGTIVINVKVSDKGKILHTKFVKLLMNKKCNAAALDAIMSVKWLPAKKEGKPITAEVDVPIKFKAELAP